MRGLPPLLGALPLLVCAGLAGEIRLVRSDPALLGGTRYVYLGRDVLDSGYVLLTAAGRSWIYAFPAVDPRHPSGSFRFPSHEGLSYRVLETGPDTLRLDRGDSAVTPHYPPPAYAILEGGASGLSLQLREDRYRFGILDLAVTREGGKRVRFARAFGGLTEDTASLEQHGSFLFHDVTLSLHQAVPGGAGTGVHPFLILGYSPIHAAGIRPPRRPRREETWKLRRPFFPHPDRPGTIVTPDGRKMTGHISAPSDP